MAIATWISLVPWATAGALLLLPQPVQAQISDAASLKRIRAALAEPPPLLQVPPPSREIPMFRVEVWQQAWTFDPLDEDAFDPTYGLPSVGELVIGGIGKIKSAAVNYKQRRTKRRARKEVQEALEAFCAVRECPAPDAGK
jgi:hypothetical protein